MICPNCSKKVSEEVIICPNCDFHLNNAFEEFFKKEKQIHYRVKKIRINNDKKSYNKRIKLTEELFKITDNLSNSIEKSYLNKNELDEWLKIGEKDFELGHETELSEFYKNTIVQLMSLYIKYRKSALSKKEAAQRIDKSPKTIDSWLRRDDYEIFLDFQHACKNITLDIIINGIKKDMTLKQASALGDLSLNNLKKLIRKGEMVRNNLLNYTKPIKTITFQNS